MNEKNIFWTITIEKLEEILKSQNVMLQEETLVKVESLEDGIALITKRDE